MKKSQNRFNTSSLSDRLSGITHTQMPATPNKMTPDLNVDVKNTAPTKTTPQLSPISATPGKVSPLINIPSSTPTKTTPNIGVDISSTTPGKSTPTLNIPTTPPVKTTPNVGVTIERTTPGKSTPTLNIPATTPKKSTPETNPPRNTPTKTTAEVGIIIEPTQPQVNNPTPTASQPTPTKTTPTLGAFNTTPVKPHVSGTPSAQTPEKTTANLGILESTPQKPHIGGIPIAQTPTKPTAELVTLGQTPNKPSADLGNLANTPTKPSAELGNLLNTPKKPTAILNTLANTPEKTLAKLSNLGNTIAKPSAELGKLEQTPNKPSAELGTLGNTAEKKSPKLGTITNVEKSSPNPTLMEPTPEKSTAVLGVMSHTEKSVPDPTLMEPTPEKTTAVLGVMSHTEKSVPDTVQLEPTPEKTTAVLGVMVPTDKTVPDTVQLEPTPEKTTAVLGVMVPTDKTVPTPAQLEPTPEKTTSALGVMVPTEKTMQQTRQLEPTPEKTTPTLGVMMPTEKTTPELGVMQHTEKTTPELGVMISTEKTTPELGVMIPTEKTTPDLGIHDGFTNMNATGFTVGKGNGKGLLTEFKGISGLPTSGQYNHTGNQGLGILAVREGIANIDAKGFTAKTKHKGDSDFLGISGDPGSMKYQIPSGASPLASYRYTKDMYAKVTGKPQSFLTPGGFSVSGTGPTGNITEDGILAARNSNASGNSGMIEQYNKYNLRDEAFHRMDGFTSGLGQPYIDSQVLANDNTKARGFKGSDGLVRGGIVARVVRTANDAVRIGKFLISPNGLLFILKNVGMQLTNPKVETFAGIDGGGFFARTTRIYPLGLSTLAQIVANVAPVGTLGLIRHGMGFLEGEKNYYENVVDEFKKTGGWEVSSKPGAPTGNRLIKLHKDLQVGLGNETNLITDPKSALGAAIGGVGGALSFTSSKITGAAKDKLGQLSGFVPGINYGSEIALLSGLGGPNSIYGIGRTTIRRSTSGIPIEQHTENNGTWADSKIVVTNYDKGPGTILASIDDAHGGLKTNPNNAQLIFTPDRPYSDVINASNAQYSIHTSEDGEAAALNIDDIKTPENWDNQIFGNVLTSEEPYSQAARQGSDNAPAGINNRNKIAGAASRFSTNNLDAIDDPRADNSQAEASDGSPLVQILNDNSDFTADTPAGLVKHNDEVGDKTEHVVSSQLPRFDTKLYGATAGDIAPYSVYAYGDIPSDQLPHNSIRDFRADIDNTDGLFQADSDGYAARIRDGGHGTHYGTRRLDRSDPTVTLQDDAGVEIGDKILIHAITKDSGHYDAASETASQTAGENDFIILKIAGIQFRAYLSSFSHNIKPEFQDIEYVGRLTDVKLMSKFSVDISLDFQVAAQSARELEGMYYKLNALAQKTAPSYGTGGKPQGPLNKITVGDYFKDVYCWINSVQFKINEQSPWDIEPGRQLPYYIDVSIGADMITSTHGNLLSAGSDFFSAILSDKVAGNWQSDWKGKRHKEKA
jgi:hypothetical protein